MVGAPLRFVKSRPSEAAKARLIGDAHPALTGVGYSPQGTNCATPHSHCLSSPTRP
jgi:hypothetical protein